MPARVRTALLSAGAAAMTAAAVLGAVTPAFAKSDTQLSGPRAAQARHAFRLTVSVGDDAGARPASARLQQLGAHGQYRWYGPWRRLRLADRDDETCAFTLTENHRESTTFRAVISGGYAITNTVQVVVR
jgi:cation diffusion facilitator CzcD-associated flavoprotein CzcO